ncbi:MAG: cytochrome P450 [Rhodospirillales bacterium]|nr:cytochrome P450 [Rhodospirillales bacterium]MCB9980699.1 cytochrome P450 [Rhodospirillales bacterium]
MIQPQIPAERKGFSFLMKVRQDPLNFFTNLMEEEGAFAWFDIRGEKVLLLNDVKGIETVLKHNNDHYHKGKFNYVLRPILGEGIILSEGTDWKKKRYEMAPSFSESQFPEMAQQMITCANEMVERIRGTVQKSGVLDIHSETTRYALDAILRALYHENPQNISEDMKNALELLLSDAENRIWSLFSLPQSFILKLPKYKQARNFLQGLVGGFVQHRKEEASGPEDLLSKLIENYGQTEAQQKVLRDQILTGVLAGHETSAIALVWCFYEMYQRPEIIKRIKEEVEEVTQNGALTYENVTQMKYTQSLFMEALRLYPPVWTISRTAIQDTSIPLENGETLFVPQGATVMLCSYAVHRREKYWKNPCAFDPERFLTANASHPQFAYFPFAPGKRMCLGHRFAIIESVIAIASIVRNFDLTLIPGQKIYPVPIITLRANRPVLFKVHTVE